MRGALWQRHQSERNSIVPAKTYSSDEISSIHLVIGRRFHLEINRVQPGHAADQSNSPGPAGGSLLFRGRARRHGRDHNGIAGDVARDLGLLTCELFDRHIVFRAGFQRVDCASDHEFVAVVHGVLRHAFGIAHCAFERLRVGA